MKEITPILGKTALFAGIQPEELSSLLSCLNPTTLDVRKDGFALREGDVPKHIGLVLEGRLHIARLNAEGERAILTSLSPGDLFAEALCCAKVAQSPVSVQADMDSRVLLVPYERIFRSCASACAFHAQLVENLLDILAQKNLTLQSRMETLSQKTLQARLLHYLESMSPGTGVPFTIPFSREALADYLCVNRSALSRELSRLKNEGVLDFWKSSFRLTEPKPPSP